MVPPPETVHNGGSGLIVITALPVIVAVQPDVAVTVYVPAPVNVPKLSDALVPVTVATMVAPLCSV